MQKKLKVEGFKLGILLIAVYFDILLVNPSIRRSVHISQVKN